MSEQICRVQALRLIAALMAQNLSNRQRGFFQRSFDCNVHVNVTDGSLFAVVQKDDKLIGRVRKIEFIGVG